MDLSMSILRIHIMRNIRIFFLVFLCSLVNIKLSAQAEWESVNTDSWSWGYNNELNIFSKTVSKLSIWNSDAETKEDKKNNKWSSKTITMQIPFTGARPYTISFQIYNKNNKPTYKYRVYEKKKNGDKKEAWHNNAIYWGYQINAKSVSGTTNSFTQYYCDRKNYNTAYTYTDAWSSDNRQWVSNADITTRTIKIEYDGKGTIKVFGGYGTTLVHTFYSSNVVSSITIHAGPAANVEVLNMSASQMSNYGLAKPEIELANKHLEQENYSLALSSLTKVITTYNYQDANIYCSRAYAYAMLDYKKSAIDDCTMALKYDSQNEWAYRTRGILKLALEDDSGVEDLRKGGAEGIAFLKEHDLLDYRPGQSRSQSQTQKSQSQPSEPAQNSLSKALNILKKANQ